MDDAISWCGALGGAAKSSMRHASPGHDTMTKSVAEGTVPLCEENLSGYVPTAPLPINGEPSRGGGGNPSFVWQTEAASPAPVSPTMVLPGYHDSPCHVQSQMISASMLNSRPKDPRKANSHTGALKQRSFEFGLFDGVLTKVANQLQQQQQPPWDYSIPKMVWRGSTTGNHRGGDYAPPRACRRETAARKYRAAHLY